MTQELVIHIWQTCSHFRLTCSSRPKPKRGIVPENVSEVTLSTREGLTKGQIEMFSTYFSTEYFFPIAAKHAFTSQACGKKLPRNLRVECTYILNQVYGKTRRSTDPLGTTICHLCSSVVKEVVNGFKFFTRHCSHKFVFLDDINQ